MADWRMGLPTLTGERVTLRQPVFSDAHALFRELCTPDVAAHAPPPPATEEAFSAKFANVLDWPRKARGFCFVVHPTKSPEAIGWIQFLGSRQPVVVPVTEPWEWGFGLGRDHWGRGLFREAARLALDFAFDEAGLQTLDAWVITGNDAAHRALRALGATPVPMTAVEAPDGRTADFVKWSMTADEWRRRS